jgi:hypothetical protein
MARQSLLVWRPFGGNAHRRLSRCLLIGLSAAGLGLLFQAQAVVADEVSEPAHEELIDVSAEEFPLLDIESNTAFEKYYPPDIDTDLPNSMPQPGSMFPQVKPQNWANTKRNLFMEHGLGLAFNYSGIVKHASNSLSGNDTAAAGWLLLSAKWKLFDRGGDRQGSVVAAFDWRHTYGSAVPPGLFLYDLGSLFAPDAAYFEWDPYFTNFFWEQWLKKDRLVFRVGQLTSYSVYGPFRFRDSRSEFSDSQFAYPAATVPLGPPAFGLNMKWWPVEGEDLYVVGTITDINGPPPGTRDYDWSGIFDTGDLFAGIEIGNYWKRSERDFDHLHLDVWYASEASQKVFRSDGGIGFRIAGQKQIEQWVGFANYSYNEVQGGGFGLTNSRQALDLGVAYLDPINISGEILAGLTWAEPLNVALPDPIRPIPTDRTQGAFELNWRFLVTPDLWVTPGFQVIWSPSFAPDTDTIFLPQFKFHISL